jgi:hypothetical protein
MGHLIFPLPYKANRKEVYINSLNLTNSIKKRISNKFINSANFRLVMIIWIFIYGLILTLGSCAMVVISLVHRKITLHTDGVVITARLDSSAKYFASPALFWFLIIIIPIIPLLLGIFLIWVGLQ